MRILFDEHVLELASGVELIAEHVGEHLAFRKTLLLRVNSERRDHAVEHVLRVLAVHDGEARREARLRRMPAQDAIADGVKRAAPQAREIRPGRSRHAVEHLARGLVRESEQQDVLRQDAVFEQVGDAIGERARLAAARAGDHQRRPRRRGDGGELLRIQLRGEIDPRAARRRAMECVLAGHRFIRNTRSTARFHQALRPVGR